MRAAPAMAVALGTPRRRRRGRTGAVEQVDAFELAYPAAGALLVRKDQAVGAFVRVQRLAVAGVGEQRGRIAEIGFEFGQCENDAIAVGGAEAQAQVQRGAAQLLAGRRAGLAQQFAERDAFPACGPAMVAGLDMAARQAGEQRGVDLSGAAKPSARRSGAGCPPSAAAADRVSSAASAQAMRFMVGLCRGRRTASPAAPTPASPAVPRPVLTECRRR